MYTQPPYVYPRSRSPTRVTAGQWQGAISQCSAQTGLNAAQCAQTLSRSRSPTRTTVYPQVNEYSPRNSPRVVVSRDNAVGLKSAAKAGSASPIRTRSRSPIRFNSAPNMTVGPIISRDNAVGLTSASKTMPSPRYNQTLNTEELRRVAQALGINSNGDNQYLVDAIKIRVGSMSPRTYGNLSPRTLNTYRGF